MSPLADFEIVSSAQDDAMDIDFKPLPEIWRDEIASPTTPAPGASSSQVVPNTSKRARRDIPKVVIPPRPQPESPSVPTVKKGKTASKSKSSGVCKTIPIEEVPPVDLLSVTELEGLRDGVDIAAVRHFILIFSFFYWLKFSL